MTAPWLDIIGIGEDGLDGLSPASITALEKAEVIIGGDRHHRLSTAITAKRLSWPSPFDAMIDTIESFRDKNLAILVTGDPLWYSVGARITRAIPAHEIRFHPQISAFQWAACRLGWSLADVETATVHGRPVEQCVPLFAPGLRILLLTKDRTTPASVAGLLRDRGYGPSKLTALAALGGPDEKIITGTADDMPQDVPDFHLLAIECRLAPGHMALPLGPGLPDDAFVHDGKMTKSEVRAVTLSRLAPRRGEHLWDIGTGCGSVAVEWLRLARDGAATGLDTRPGRLDMARRNALQLGTPRLKLIEGKAPDALAALAPPNAVFIGGGFSEAVVSHALKAMLPHGRLVANAVTLESEALLIRMHAKHGGHLAKINIARAEPVGPYRGWRSFMPVTQWSLNT